MATNWTVGDLKRELAGIRNGCRIQVRLEIEGDGRKKHCNKTTDIRMDNNTRGFITITGHFPLEL